MIKCQYLLDVSDSDSLVIIIIILLPYDYLLNYIC